MPPLRDMPLLGHLRLCLTNLSHKARISTIPAHTAKSQLTPEAIKLLFGKRHAEQGLKVPEMPVFGSRSKAVTTPEDNVEQPAMLLRRHRGGKVKNKLRNIEKKKKKEQNTQKWSSDVMFK